MGFLETFHICECPPSTLEGFTIHPKPPTPVDSLGYKYKCCWCIPLKIATVLICLVTLAWAVIELQGADKLLGAIFSEDGNFFYYMKVLYVLMCVLLVLACGVLLLGLITDKSRIVTVFLWYSFVFICTYVALVAIGTVSNVLETGEMEKRQAFQLIGSVLWTCIFFYFLIVVNSYRVLFWL